MTNSGRGFLLLAIGIVLLMPAAQGIQSIEPARNLLGIGSGVGAVVAVVVGLVVACRRDKPSSPSTQVANPTEWHKVDEGDML